MKRCPSWQHLGCQTLAAMPADRLKALEERTLYDPTEVEARVFSRWEEAGIFYPEPEGDPSENYSIAVPAAERDRQPAHGPRAERLDPGRLHPRCAHAGAARQVDLRHRPRGHRDPAPGREAARGRGHEPRGDRTRGVRARACGSGARSTATRSSASSAHWAPRSTTRTSASRWTTSTSGRSCTCSCACTRRGSSTATTTWSTGTPACARRSPTSRSSSARSRTRSTCSTTRSSPARAR